MSEDEGAQPPVAKDKTPSLADQAKGNGWSSGIFSFGKAENESTHYFNPSLVERPDGLWLIVRRAEFKSPLDKFGMNACWAFRLNAELQPEEGWRLKFPMQSGIEQFEDPRTIFYNGRIFVGACNFIWYENGEWTGAHQVLGVFKCDPGNETNDWSNETMFRPEIGGNSLNVDEKGVKHEKNWLWFAHEGRIHLLYYSKPWRVASFGKSLAEITPYESEGASWRYGEIRGGTPPILVPASLTPELGSQDLYWTFFHSSMPWVDRFRRYYMGAIAFESKPPFAPVYITPDPLLTGSQNDYWQPRKPLVVFPGGARFKDGKWLVVYGINDLKCGYVEIPHADLIKRMRPIRSLDKIDVLDAQSSDYPITTALQQHNEEQRLSFELNSRHVLSEVQQSNGSSVPTLGDEIRFHVDALCKLENNQSSRKLRILSELRKRKLVPKARQRA